MSAYDLIVLGAGPGGYHAAIRAGQLGLRTLVVEKGALGGVCLNVGCIPTKALLHAAQVLDQARAAKRLGIRFGEPQVDLEALGAFRDRVVEKLVKGVGFLLKQNGVEVRRGTGRLVAPGTVAVVDGSGWEERLEARAVILATGSRPAGLPGLEPDGETVWTSTDALALKEVPQRLLIVGAGAIGLEMATIYSRLGSQVTVVELLDQILPGTDRQVAGELHKALKRQRIQVLLETTVEGWDPQAGEALLKSVKDGSTRTVAADRILVAVGRRPNTEGLSLEAVGVRTDPKGYVLADETLRTNVDGIYAIGDVTGPPLLAHRAMKQGVVAAEVVAGRAVAFEPQGIPWVVYTLPEVAGVGLSQERAEAAGYRVRVGVFPYTALGRAATVGETAGLVKVVADAETDLLLGFFAVGPQAESLVAEGTLALEMGATLEDLDLTVHPHPAFSEAVMEAAAAAHGRAIHILNRR